MTLPPEYFSKEEQPPQHLERYIWLYSEAFLAETIFPNIPLNERLKFLQFIDYLNKESEE